MRQNSLVWLRGRASLLIKPTVPSVGKDALSCFCSHVPALLLAQHCSGLSARASFGADNM